MKRLTGSPTCGAFTSVISYATVDPTSNSKTKRPAARRIGGWQDGSADSEEVSRLAAQSVKDIERMSNSTYRLHLVDIIKVKKQAGGGHRVKKLPDSLHEI